MVHYAAIFLSVGLIAGGGECVWPRHTSDSGGLDLAVEWRCLGDYPQGDGTYQPGVLTDQIHCEGSPMKGSYDSR